MEEVAADGKSRYKKTPFDKREGVFVSERLVLCLSLLFGGDVHKGSGNNFSGEIFDLFGLEFNETIDE